MSTLIRLGSISVWNNERRVRTFGIGIINSSVCCLSIVLISKIGDTSWNFLVPKWTEIISISFSKTIYLLFDYQQSPERLFSSRNYRDDLIEIKENDHIYINNKHFRCIFSLLSMNNTLKFCFIDSYRSINTHNERS